MPHARVFETCTSADSVTPATAQRKEVTPVVAASPARGATDPATFDATPSSWRPRTWPADLARQVQAWDDPAPPWWETLLFVVVGAFVLGAGIGLLDGPLGRWWVTP